MRGCASKTGTGRIVMIITIRQLNPLLGASLPTFCTEPESGGLHGLSAYKKRKLIF